MSNHFPGNSAISEKVDCPFENSKSAVNIILTTQCSFLEYFRALTEEFDFTASISLTSQGSFTRVLE